MLDVKFVTICLYLPRTKLLTMSRGSLYDKVMTIFSTTMIFSYMGLAYLILFSSLFSHVDITFRAIFSIPLVLYGGYRIVTSYQQIKENFFESDGD